VIVGGTTVFPTSRSEFRRVNIPRHARGLLGQGSVIVQDVARENRTSPVLRGKWVMEVLIGMPPPPAATESARVDER